MGFLPDIKRILALMPEKRQSLMFSATFSEEIKKLANNILVQPILIEAARRNSVSNLVTHVVHPVDRERKRELLSHLIKSKNLQQVLVFVRTKHGANNLAKQLERDGVSSTAIHGDKSQPQRTQALEEFKKGEVRVLVATDVAARGLDIEDLPHVTNYELPNTPEDYIHRIGRTGRAGTKGWATSLVCGDEHELLEGIEKLIKVKLTKEIISGFGPVAENDSVKPTNKPSEKERRSHNKEEVRDAHTNNKKNLEFDSKKRTSSKEPQDPLFSQPYVPTTKTNPTKSKSEPVTTAVASLSLVKNKPDSHPKNQRKEKPIPALFLPISANSPKQNK